MHINILPGHFKPRPGLSILGNCLFDFDPKNNSRSWYRDYGDDNRKQNIGSEALGLLIQYASFKFASVHANITENEASKALLLNLALNASV
jgi:hypothetical protein